MRLLSVDAPAVVLGSTQRAPATAPDGMAVVRRQSGGGAVLLEPRAQVWADVFIPRADPHWDDDVARAFLWLGQAWVDALTSIGIEGAAVHHGGLCTTQWSRLVCFAGLGTGEVTIGERKVVGLSQRRTRAGALFQCAAPLVWHPAPLVAALGLPAEALADIADVVAPVEGVDASAIEAAFLAALGSAPA
ncbi:MAG: lipoate--protein ligase family protein [Actinobacteria bacterium]|nr:lipoate--protein ligase family protein [Actinomycetota bacterium]